MGPTKYLRKWNRREAVSFRVSILTTENFEKRRTIEGNGSGCRGAMFI